MGAFSAQGMPRRRLLLVSDDATSAEALRAHLTRHGFLVSEANSARTAFKAADEARPDVALIDAAIHGGWQRVVEALDPVMSRRSIAVLAAYWTSDGRLAAEAVGIGGILLKQLEGEALVARLHDLGDGANASSWPLGSRQASPSGGAR